MKPHYIVVSVVPIGNIDPDAEILPNLLTDEIRIERLSQGMYDALVDSGELHILRKPWITVSWLRSRFFVMWKKEPPYLNYENIFVNRDKFSVCLEQGASYTIEDFRKPREKLYVHKKNTPTPWVTRAHVLHHKMDKEDIRLPHFESEDPKALERLISVSLPECVCNDKIKNNV